MKIKIKRITPILMNIDYKSGKISKYPKPLQLAIYSVYLFHKYPNVDVIRSSFVYIEHLQEKSYTFKREHLPALTKSVIRNIAKIENAKNFPKVESPLCQYCEYRRNNVCKPETQAEFQDKIGKMVKIYKPKKGKNDEQ